jgi:multiple sugar transport system ATP-binding protein
MASVTYRNIKKKFGDTLVFQDVNIEIEDGEFMVFVGPSGSGKSTALRMLAGLDTITGGEILLDDEVINDKKIQRRDVAMVFQSYALYPHMNVYKNIAFGLQQRNIDKDEIDKRVRETAQTLGIGDFLERRPRDLSGGQRQRVALARAIVREPKAFLLDEPLSNLDAKLRVEARAFLSDLHNDLQATFIYVTHDQVEAMTLGDRIAVMAQNYLQQVDTPSNLYNYPDNLFVAGFIGSPAMNFFDATLREENGEFVIDAGHFQLPPPEYIEHLLPEHKGKDVVVGIRPKDIHHPDYTPTDINPVEIEAQVDIIEMLGDELDVYLRFEEDSPRFAARVDPRVEADRGDTMQFVMDLKSVHLFDAETELVIRDDPPPSDHAKMIAEERRGQRQKGKDKDKEEDEG